MKGWSLVVGVAVVIGATVAGACWVAGQDVAAKAPRYGFIRALDDAVVVHFDNHLVWLNAQGEETQAEDLAALGLQLAGDFDFFDAGGTQLLAYHRAHTSSLWISLQRLFRQQATLEYQSRGNEGFYRCDLPARSCSPFGAQLPRFDSAFRLAIDRPGSRVYVAHTSAFRLFLLDGEGTVLAQAGADNRFKFPNALALTKGEVWLADTNHHRLVQLAGAPENFGAVLNEMPVRLGGQHRWPHQVSWWSAAQQFWVLVGDNALRDGRLAVFDTTGQALGQAQGLTLADPMALTFWRDQLWVADFSTPLLHRYRAEGLLLKSAGPVASPTLARLAAHSQAQVDKGQRWQQWGLIGFVSVLVLGVIAALVLERDASLAVFAGRPSALARRVNAPVAPADQPLWLTNIAVKRLRQFQWGLVAMASCVFAGLALFPEWAALPIKLLWPFLAMGLLLMLLAALAYLLLLRLSRQRLGVVDDHLLFAASDGEAPQILQPAQLCYTEHYLLTESLAIALGRPGQRVFDEQQLADWVFPRLKPAQPISTWSLGWRLWRLRQPELILPAAMVVLALLAMVCVQVGRV